MDEYVYLLLVEVGDEAFLVESPHGAKAGDMIRFSEEGLIRTGEVVDKFYASKEDRRFIGNLKPVCQAVKIWRTDWEAGNPGQ